MKWSYVGAATALLLTVSYFTYGQATPIAGPKQAPARRSIVPVIKVQQQKPPERFETTIYDSWRVVCEPPPSSGAKNVKCTATLRVIDSGKRLVLLIWTIQRNADGKLELTLQTRTNVQIDHGVQLTFGNSAIRQLKYASCTTGGCSASSSMDNAMVKDASAAANAKVTIQSSVSGRTINYDVSIKGIDKVLAAIK